MTIRSTPPSGLPTARPARRPGISVLLGKRGSTDQHSSKGARLLNVTWHLERATSI
ncbi:hypothetical protein [Streptomyces sp. CoT10]|uniref:hypothetical protein n=1 Tax=Streptomyces sp. CoT10 TaxID=2875762 RepID=UPI001CD6034E|nr:hypothetical protein [Streptomyces sp. CoT10]